MTVFRGQVGRNHAAQVAGLERVLPEIPGRLVLVVEIEIGPPYACDDSVGSEPSVVYRIVAEGSPTVTEAENPLVLVPPGTETAGRALTPSAPVKFGPPGEGAEK